MSSRYPSIAFTEQVRLAQSEHGSRRTYARQEELDADQGPETLTDSEVEFLTERDSFYLATCSETGWPYVQLRGGSPGFVHVLDPATIAWADLRGNRQYISTGNLAANDRVAMIAVDYPNRLRLKLFGRARIETNATRPDLIAGMAPDRREGIVESAFVVSVEAFSWNCPQHITPRYTLAELEPYLADLRQQVADLAAENAALRARTDP